MAENTQAVRAGLFVVIAIAATFVLLVMLGSFGRWLDPRPTRLVSFPVSVGVAGLSPGDPVRLGGVKVGSVSHVRVDPAHDGEEAPLVVVEFELPGQFVLREDADVRVGGTVTGLAWLEIFSLGEDEPLAKGAMITGKAGSFQSLLVQMSELAPQIGEAIAQVRGETIPRLNKTLDAGADLVHRVDDNVAPIVERVHQFAEAGAGAMTEAKEVLGESKTDIRGTIANLRDTTDTLRERLPSTLERVDSFLEEGHRLAANLNESSEDLKLMLADGRVLSSDARSLVSRSRGKIERIVDAMQSAAIDAKLGLAEIRRSPWRLLHKPEQREEELLDLYASAREFAEGAREVSQAATALRDAAADPQIDEAALSKLLGTLEAQTAELGEAQNLFWQRIRKK